MHETISHVLVYCRLAKEVWLWLCPMEYRREGRTMEFVDWVAFMLKAHDSELKAKFLVAAWWLWYARNNWVMEGFGPRFGCVLSSALPC